MKRKLKSLIRFMPVAALLTGSACAHHAVSTGLPRSGEVYTGKIHRFFAGLVSDEQATLNQRCPYGVSQSEIWRSGGDFAAGFFTSGIYSPRSYKVWCGAAPQRQSIAPPH